MPNNKDLKTEDVESILFITLSCVGDAVMTTPALQALHKNYPLAQIDIVADKRSSYLFSRCPYRGDIIHKDKNKIFRGALGLIKRLRQKPYDLIVDLRTDGIAYLLKGKKRLGKWNKQAYGAHAIEDLMGTIRSIHGDEPIPPTCVWLGKEHEAYANTALSGLPGNRWLAMAPGVKAERKRWPGKKYAELANSLSDIFEGVIFVGSHSEQLHTRAVKADLRLPSVDLAGSDLLEAAAVLGRASMFVGSDSGLGHIAGAMGTATMTLFSTEHPDRYLPWGPSASWLRGEGDYVSKIAVADVEAKIRQAVSA
jgi:heptosyltransferase III